MEANTSASAVPAGRFAREQAERLLGRLAVQIARTTRSRGAADIHDLRVAIRRFLGVLAVFKDYFPGDESRKIRQRLKKIMLRAGSVRDCDVALLLLAKQSAPASQTLARQFRGERAEDAKALAVSLKRWVRRNSSATWRSALESGAMADFRAGPVESLARRTLPRLAKKYFRCGKDAARQAAAEELHSFRIAAKNLRYALDLFAPVYGDSVSGILEELKGMQKLLGGVTDCATVRRMAARQEGVEEVLAALKKRQRRKAGEFRRHWNQAFSSGAAAARWTDCLRLRRTAVETRVARKPPGRSAPAAMASRGSASA